MIAGGLPDRPGMRPPAPKVSVAGGRSERRVPPDILAAAKPYKEMIRGGREPAEMRSFRHPRVFDPLDFEIIDRVCEAAWAQLEAESRSAIESRMKNGRRR